MKRQLAMTAAACFGMSLTTAVFAVPFVFDNGLLDGRMAVATRPASAGKFEIEAADDFLLTNRTLINSATFTGLIPTGTSLSSIGDVRVEIYRIFPKDSDTTRTPHVPSKTNSPSDVAFAERESVASTLSFTTTSLGAGAALNSVQPGGIHASPNQTTGGNGAVSGQEVRFSVTFATPFDLPADHYFFIPQVQLTTAGDFLWLSSVRPIVAPGTPFTPDLQAWTRDDALDPDWLRVGTDIVGGASPPTFNLAFSLAGEALAAPEPASVVLALTGLLALCFARQRQAVGLRATHRGRLSA